MFLSGRGRYETQRCKPRFADDQSPNPHVHVGSGDGGGNAGEFCR
jgi:hypothetical protein